MLKYCSVRNTGIKPGHKTITINYYKFSIDKYYFQKSKFK